MGYGLFLLDPDSRRFLLENLPKIQDPVVRGEAWLTLWDEVLEGEVAPGAFLDLAAVSIRKEEEEQILQQLLGNVRTIFWSLLPDDVRRTRAPELEAVLWAGANSGEDTSRQAAFFRAFRAIALTPDGLDRLEQVWAGNRAIPGLTLSEEDRTSLASTLALHAVTGWEGILEQQLQDIENPDRRARFEFVLPSLNADPEVREAFFGTLRQEENREKEPWVLEAVSNLHHPLRRQHALQFITPSLQLLEEIQETGDIFFPGRWVDATLGGHNSPEAADEVREFLKKRPDYPFRLRLKILQAADPLFRAEEILGSSPP
jgi:aminopeptidase N